MEVVTRDLADPVEFDRYLEISNSVSIDISAQYAVREVEFARMPCKSSSTNEIERLIAAYLCIGVNAGKIDNIRAIEVVDDVLQTSLSKFRQGGEDKFVRTATASATVSANTASNGVVASLPRQEVVAAAALKGV